MKTIFNLKIPNRIRSQKMWIIIVGLTIKCNYFAKKIEY